ncbi:vacuolar transporter chaperone [Mortierella claussenii]|nr:vacuolar transporter chaperone [Mortierella claussenii]
MKFGTQLKSHRASHWRYHYVDYDGLKAFLKSKTHDRAFTQDDEVEFVRLLTAELEKVASFQALKLGEVQRRTEHCEYTIQQHQEPSGKSSEKLTLASFVVTESEINKITQDLRDLARFQRLNYTAFLKMIKKHDKHTGFLLRPHFMNQQLTLQPFHKESFASLVSRLSSLYNIVRTGTAPQVSRAQSIDSAGDEEEEEHSMLLEHLSGCRFNKTAFWVHPDCVMDLKMLILKYLPLVVYEPTPALNSSHKSSSSQLSSYLASESPVSTIYLDNQELDLYMGQMEHRDQSETVRVRWYGSEQKQMWVEHQQRSVQSTTGSSNNNSHILASSPLSSEAASSFSPVASATTTTQALEEPMVTKHRFQIKSKYVPKLLQGTAKMNKAVDLMRRSGQKTEQEIQRFEELTRKVQTRIKDQKLQPVVQTFFNRTAFQVPGDTRVRITIDTDVVMVRERSVEPSDLYDRPWNPVELKAEDYPFPNIKDQDIVRFPYAIMQIRTLTEQPHPHEETEDHDEENRGEEGIPGWIDHIAQSHLVEMVPNFAKDLHAMATLYESRVGLLPFWLSDMDRDIRKPAMLTGGFPRRSTLQDSNSNSGSNDTMTSGQSTAATTISDSGGSPTSSGSTSKSASQLKNKPRSPRKSILDSNEIYTPGVTFDEEVQDLVANRMMIERQGGEDTAATAAAAAAADALAVAASTSEQAKVKKPVVSCLKKYGSFNSMQSRNSSNEDLFSSRANSEGYGSASSSISSQSGRRQQNKRSRRGPKRVTFFEKSTWWDRMTSWIPSFHYLGDNEDDSERISHDLEGQYFGNGRLYYRDNSLRAKIHRGFWTGLSGLNILLLFVGLVLALMNLGDSVGLEAASLFLVVSCLCMGTTVWAHLIRMDGHDHGPSLEDGDLWNNPYGHYSYNSNSNSNKGNSSSNKKGKARYTERSGLLSPGGTTLHASQYTHAGHRGRWVRTRVMPMTTFVCLAAVVSLNAWVRMHPYSEDVGKDLKVL